MFDCGGWQFDFFDRDRMADRGKHGGNVSVDAVTQQLQQLSIVTQFGDLGDHDLLDRAGELGHPLVQPTDDGRRRLRDDRGIVLAHYRHDQTINLQPAKSSGSLTTVCLRKTRTCEDLVARRRRRAMPCSATLMATVNHRPLCKKVSHP